MLLLDFSLIHFEAKKHPQSFLLRRHGGDLMKASKIVRLSPLVRLPNHEKLSYPIKLHQTMD